MTPPRWPHQQAALDTAAQYEAFGLFLDMGAGKSRIAVDLADRWDCNRVLLICPKGVLSVWPEEVVRWSRRPWYVVAPDQRDSKGKAAALANHATQAFQQRRPLWAILNYESAWRPVLAATLRSIEWDLCVLDESHRIKSPGGKASKFFGHLGRRMPRRLALTGTPMPNSPLDVYAQFRFLAPWVFGTRFEDFRARYAIMGGFENREVIRWVNQGELSEKIASLSVQVRTRDVLDLPPEVDQERYAVLEPKAKRVYRDLHKEFIAGTAAGIVTVSNALTKLLRLHQIASAGLLQYDDGTHEVISRAKRMLLRDTLRDLPPGEPLVVFCLFRHSIQLVLEELARAGRSAAELSGTHHQLAEWQSGMYNALVVQIKAGSEGISMTRARYVLYYDLTFDLGAYLQSRARIMRPGQQHAVTYLHLLTKGTVDTKIHRALRDKRAVVDAILDELPFPAE